MKAVGDRAKREKLILRHWDNLQVRRSYLLINLQAHFPRNSWWEVFLSSKRKTPTVMKVIGYEVDGRLRVSFWMDRRTAGHAYRGRRPYFRKSVGIEQIGDCLRLEESEAAR